MPSLNFSDAHIFYNKKHKIKKSLEVLLLLKNKQKTVQRSTHTGFWQCHLRVAVWRQFERQQIACVTLSLAIDWRAECSIKCGCRITRFTCLPSLCSSASVSLSGHSVLFELLFVLYHSIPFFLFFWFLVPGKSISGCWCPTHQLSDHLSLDSICSNYPQKPLSALFDTLLASTSHLHSTR